MYVYIVTMPKSSLPIFNDVHYHMFHGIASRHGAPLALPISIFSPKESYYPVEIMRSGKVIPDVFAPIGVFVVSQRVKVELEKLNNVDFKMVKFVKLFKEFFDKRDFSYPKERQGSDLIRDFANDPAMYRKSEPYYEIIHPLLREISKKYVTDTSSNEPQLDLLSCAMLKEYPVIRDTNLLLSESAYSILQKHLDKDFFSVREVPLSKPQS